MTEAPVPDLRHLGTDRLGELYVDLLRRGGDLRDSALQREWSRRPKAERMAALRLCRERAASDAATLVEAQAAH